MDDGLRRFLADPVASWQSGTSQSQRILLVALLAGVTVCAGISLYDYNAMPLTAYFVWLVLGMISLRFVPLVILSAWIVGAVTVALVVGQVSFTQIRIVAMASFLLSLGLVLFASSRQRSGLPGPVGDSMLANLRDRLQSQSQVPPLPVGWRSQSAMIAADGVGYGGDFMVVALSEDHARLEMILVDVCGKGVGAATEALQFAGALGGLIGSLPPIGLFEAANDFLLRQNSEETFATAAHVAVELPTGRYSITSAGHPPVLRWTSSQRSWYTEEARGTALGIMRRPELIATEGVLAPGDGLLFYTDGVVESRTNSLDDGVNWLRQVAAEAVRSGFEGAPRRIIRRVERGDDDRAVLMLWRDLAPV